MNTKDKATKIQDTSITNEGKKSTEIDWNEIKEALKEFPVINKTGSCIMPVRKPLQSAKPQHNSTPEQATGQP